MTLFPYTTLFRSKKHTLPQLPFPSTDFCSAPLHIPRTLRFSSPLRAPQPTPLRQTHLFYLKKSAHAKCRQTNKIQRNRPKRAVTRGGNSGTCCTFPISYRQGLFGGVGCACANRCKTWDRLETLGRIFVIFFFFFQTGGIQKKIK